MRAWNNFEATGALGRAARADYLARYTAGRNYRQLMDIYERVVHAGVGEAVSEKTMAANA
jgi:hypothetical protein